MFHVSPDTQALADRLAAVAYGAQITHAELSEVIGRDIRKVRYLLYAAFRRVASEHGAIFDPIRGVGYKRVLVEEAHTIGHTARRGIRRKARRAMRDMNAITSRANDIPNGTLLKANREQSTLGLIEMAAKDRHLSKADSRERPEPVAKVAQEFLNELTK